MKTTLGKLLLPVIIFSALGIFIACHKETSNSTGTIPPGKEKLSVFLTDGPFDFQKVLVDIKSIQVLVDTCHRFGDADDEENDQGGDNNEGRHNGDGEHNDHHGDATDSVCDIWTTLSIHPGIYDLLKLRNGADTLLGSSFIPIGKIIKIKITLGNDNTIMADSVVSPLKIRGNQDFVIINIRNEHLDSIAPNNFQTILDFNLANSITFVDSTYWLTPVIRAFSEKHTGTIEGKVRPPHSFGMIQAFNATDTAFALPEEDNADEDNEGEFKIRGLRQGTYSVLIMGINGYMDSTIHNVQVSTSEETELGKIVMHK
jgi:hypothetical protein